MDELKALIRDLIPRVDRLTEQAEHITPRVDEIERTAKQAKLAMQRGRWALWALAVVAALLVALGGRLWMVVDDQDRTTQRALCPVFSLLIGGYNPESRAPGADRDLYNQQFSLFRDAYVALECRDGIVPPPIRN